MPIVNVANILIGLVLWLIPQWKFPARGFGGLATRKNILYGRRKQIVSGLFIAAGIVGLVAGLHENVIIVLDIIFWFAALIMADYPPDTCAPSKPSSVSPKKSEAGQQTTQQVNDIVTFLSKPENAALKARVMANLTERATGELLIRQMGLPLFTTYGPDFFESMQDAVGRLKQLDQSRPSRPSSTGTIPKFDVVLVDPGDSAKVLVVKAVMQLAQIDLKAAQALINHVPATIVTGETQDQAELVRDVLEDIGVTVELVAVDAQKADSNVGQL